jgi:metallo-beta-lactamase family protein
MQITFLGAARTVTGSRYLISINNKKILVDCGLYQGHKELRLRNWTRLPVDPKSIDAVILTHAHIDHSGYIPVLIKNGFSGRIYCTQGTKDLCAILLPDCGHLEEEDANRANRYGYSKHKPALPLYTREDALRALDFFSPLTFDKPFPIVDGLIVTLLPAGHIIGSSIVRLTYNNKTIIFTGDLGRPHHPIHKPPAIITHTDYLITESTYGNKLHDESSPQDQMAEIINNTVNEGGSIVIPAFAVGRTQDVLYYIHALKQSKRIPDVPVFLDSPMAQDVSDLLVKYSGEHRLTPEMCKAICKTARYIRTPEESKAIDQYKTPVIIISASGMATGGRVLHHLKVFLAQHRNSILFTGYQDPGTRGDRLVRGEPEIKIHGESYPVNAQIFLMQNMSAHADYREMLGWLKHFRTDPKKIFITHGELPSALSLKNIVTEEFGWDCEIPEYLQSYAL